LLLLKWHRPLLLKRLLLVDAAAAANAAAADRAVLGHSEKLSNLQPRALSYKDNVSFLHQSLPRVATVQDDHLTVYCTGSGAGE
jgi:hypothetical protein